MKVLQAILLNKGFTSNSIRNSIKFTNKKNEYQKIAIKFLQNKILLHVLKFGIYFFNKKPNLKLRKQKKRKNEVKSLNLKQ